jgi:hypothetical protein
MQNRAIERFLLHALPQELETLRLIDLERVRIDGMTGWRSHFVPVTSLPRAIHSWEFTTDMLWDVTDTPPSISFMTIAGIAIPQSARRWLEHQIREYNQDAPAVLGAITLESGKLSLFAELTCEMSAEELKLLVSRAEGRIAERFVESYETVSECLFAAWQEGVRIGQEYRRTMN